MPMQPLSNEAEAKLRAITEGLNANTEFGARFYEKWPAYPFVGIKEFAVEVRPEFKFDSKFTFYVNDQKAEIPAISIQFHYSLASAFPGSANGEGALDAGYEFSGGPMLIVTGPLEAIPLGKDGKGGSRSKASMAIDRAASALCKLLCWDKARWEATFAAGGWAAIYHALYARVTAIEAGNSRLSADLQLKIAKNSYVGRDGKPAVAENADDIIKECHNPPTP